MRFRGSSSTPTPTCRAYRYKLGVGSGVEMAHLIKDMLCVCVEFEDN